MVFLKNYSLKRKVVTDEEKQANAAAQEVDVSPTRTIGEDAAEEKKPESTAQSPEGDTVDSIDVLDRTRAT